MRLKSISMAGFKSFANRTKLSTDAAVTGIVGPNGCGKSNIADAFRWVMGESRASQLRQENSDAIIFNGSASRRPADWCSVEIHLRNDGKRDLGMWQEYAEISIRRQLERDGDSNYFINGQRVRRRDVIDLFSGTGSGARSYGVVEQEQITQIVHAEPKRIRAHLEEAAGVAVYKGRRRETERRIDNTQANLERLGDAAQELHGQLAALAKQAQLTVQVRKFNQQLNDLRRFEVLLRLEELESTGVQVKMQFDAATKQLKVVCNEVETKEGRLTELRAVRQKHNEALSKLQQRQYSALAQVERVRQQQREADLVKEQDQRQLAQAQLASTTYKDGCNELRKSIKQLAEKLCELERSGGQLEGDVARLRMALEVAREAAAKAETGNVLAEHELEQAAQQMRQATSAEELALYRVEDSEQTLRSSRQELDNLAPLEESDTDGLNKARDEARKACEQAVANERKRQDLYEELVDAKESLAHLQATLGGLRAEQELLLDVSGRVQQKYEKYSAWLAQHGQGKVRRFAEVAGIKATGCEVALDAVLEHLLDGYPVADLAGLVCQDDLPAGMVLINRQVEAAPALPASRASLEPLSNLVQALPEWQPCLAHWLSGVYYAKDINSALLLQDKLRPSEILVTPTGHVFRRGVVEVHRVREAGIAWAARCRKIEKETGACEKRVTQDTEVVKNLVGEVERVRNAGERLAQARQDADARLASMEMEVSRLRHAKEFRQAQVKRLREGINQVTATSAQRKQALAAVTADLAVAEKSHAAQTERAAALRIVLEESKLTVEKGTCSSNEQESNLRSIKLTIDHEKQRQQDLHNSLGDQEKLLADACVRSAEMQVQLKATNTKQFDAEIKAAITGEDKAGRNLAAAQAKTAELATLETDKEQELAALRRQQEGTIAQHRQLELDTNTKAIEIREVGNQLDDLGGVPSDVGQLREKYRIPAEVSSRIAKLERRVELAGPINYAADAEHASCEERRLENKTQTDDLETALASLQLAISRIDKEMLLRLRNVFKDLNHRFAEKFTQLFDGGRASIELLGDSLLTDGLEFKATPPGKRVSSIQALSGGEKTLTALAFLFALNDLNPPPFCVLDEVDAALDEVNTERFCRLLMSMRDSVQFFVVSHNKAVIEKMDKLVGVTQEEKGVSKLVSVKVDEVVANALVAARGRG